MADFIVYAGVDDTGKPKQVQQPISTETNYPVLPIVGVKHAYLSGTAVGVSVGASGDTTLATIDVANYGILAFQFDVATQNLDAFKINVRYHASGSYLLLYSTSGDYTTPKNDLIYTSGDLTATAAGSTGFVKMYLDAYESIRIDVSAVADSATVSAFWGMQ